MTAKILRKKGFIQILAYISAFAFIMSNAAIAYAASGILLTYNEIVLSEQNVDGDLYLTDVISLDNGKTFAGIFRGNYGNRYYGTSIDLVNWDLKAEYFSMIYGNETFVGLSYAEDGSFISSTKNGETWVKAKLDDSLMPEGIKFENGYFKLYVRNEDYKERLFISEDAVKWFDVTDDLPQGGAADHVIISPDGDLYALVGTSESATGFTVKKATAVNENPTEWVNIASLAKEGYGLCSNFVFNGKQVGVELYSIADYENNVNNNVYYVTTDFVNWEEKDWTQNLDYYYNPYTESSTSDFSFIADTKKFEAVETYLFEGENGEIYYASYVVHSNDGVNFVRDEINVFVNGKQVNAKPNGKIAYDYPTQFSWAQKGIEYTLGRGYMNVWILYYEDLSSPARRSDCLELVINALGIPAPKTIPEGFTPFVDVGSHLVNRAKMLGIVNGVDGSHFLPWDKISRQDMMVMIYNALRYAGAVEPDSELGAIASFADNALVRDYAKIPVSSLVKAGIINGDGVNINPLGNVTYAEIMVIAERLNKFRMR